jgi:bacteriocin-like protein
MKNLEFEKYGMEQLSNEELRSIDGGYSWDEFCQDCRCNWEAVKSGAKELAEVFQQGRADAHK